ncbi:MAG: histidinol dehydrogenase [Candidatus Dasytiphilus stammeri]
MYDFTKIINWEKCNNQRKNWLLQRPAINISNAIKKTVCEIINKVKKYGDEALYEYNLTLEGIKSETLDIIYEKTADAKNHLSENLKNAIIHAAKNITTFHGAQKLVDIDIETQPGVRCQQITRPIASVGLYVPGGSAPLLSTVLMLAIPAKLAGCQRIVLCSPPPITYEILYAAQLCGIKEIFQIGGAQAIAALAFGTETIPKVDKIFGPGNVWVTEAKNQVRQYGIAIDIPAGPSEVLIIADSGANPQFIASDLLSQAEHGAESQSILLTPDRTLAEMVVQSLITQLNNLPRATIARNSLKSSRLILTTNLRKCIEISNQYGPEHLMIQTRNARKIFDHIVNAGSVFLGNWSPESAGDYASGTNHVLPTYGYTSTYSSLSVLDFQKRITVQELTTDGLMHIATTVETLASAENLMAHKNAISQRINAIKEAL